MKIIMSKAREWTDHLNRWQEFLIVAGLSLVMVFGITIGMGTITCGYHMVDDHEFLEWTYQMANGESVWHIISAKLKSDFNMRYEPAYYASRILITKLMGIDLTMHSVMKALEIVFSAIFLYYCGKKMGANRIYSFLFSVVALLGYQSATWWKLGPQESQCTLFFSAGFYCMLRWLDHGKKRWGIISIVLFFIMCNFKESFILLLPFLMLYVLYHELTLDDTKLSWRKVWGGCKKRLWYLIALGIIFAALVFIIIVFVGVNDYDKVGLDASVPVDVYVEALRNALSGDLKWFKRFGILFGLILLTYWEELKKLWKEMLLVIVFLLPQFIIFGQTGIAERYILPSSIGFALFFVIIIPKWKPLSGKRRAVYVLGLLLLIAAHGRVALREADYFRYRGESVSTMLAAVQEMSGEDKNILSCYRPNEEGNLTINYWMLVHGRDNVYFWTDEDEVINRVCDLNLGYPSEYYEECDFDDMDIVAMYNKEDRHWCYTPKLDLSGFTELKCGTMTIYIRDDAGIVPVDTEVEGLRINF